MKTNQAIKHKLKLLMFTLIVITCVKAHTQVNLQEGSFNLTAKDFGLIERTYSSRSLHRGFFGFGWCSVLDVTKDSNCNQPRNPFPNLKMRFNETGQIISWGKLGTEVKVLYRQGMPVEIKSENLRFQVNWVPDKMVISRIYRTPLHAIEYTYQDENLVRFTGLNPAELKYDVYHNLTELVSTKTALKIKYLEIEDVVSEVKGLGPCYESYRFLPVDSKGLQFAAEVSEVCPKGNTLKARMDFQFEKQQTGNLKLISTKIWKLNAGGPE